MLSDCEVEYKNKDLSEIGDNNVKENGECLSAAQKARSERNRQKAQMLREARLVKTVKCEKINTDKKMADSGGGFFFEEEMMEPPKLAARPSPFVHSSEQPYCLECNQQFAQSYLMDTFDYSVCDSCRFQSDFKDCYYLNYPEHHKI